MNDAGAIAISTTEELEEEAWDLVMNVNASDSSSKAVIPYMKRRGGQIINVASIAGERDSTLPHYCASKHAVVGFTNTLAKELAQTGITKRHLSRYSKALRCGPLAEAWRRPGESWEEL